MLQKTRGRNHSERIKTAVPDKENSRQTAGFFLPISQSAGEIKNWEFGIGREKTLNIQRPMLNF
jgi:hypothetical protein